MLHSLLAQTYDYTTTTDGSEVAIFSGVWLLIWLVFAVVLIAGMWKMFQKAGEPGWAAIIPIYNTYVLLKIAGREWWWLLLLLIPFVNIVVAILVGIDVAKRFGYSPAFGAIVNGILGIGYAIIGFSKATYSAAPQASSVSSSNDMSNTPPTTPTTPQV
jgi:hypothetical protein